MSSNKRPQERIGVYVCHCGSNIAGVVDVADVSAWAGKELEQDGVVVARDYKFMCSSLGQELIERDIKEKGLTRVVVAACSPHLHEPTFRAACARAGVNPYLFEMTNIREQDSWVTTDKIEATKKAKALIAAAVGRVAYQKPLESLYVPIDPNVLIVGGGVTGIQAALEIANSGQHVYLVEREPSIGGHMAQFDKTFPTLDCSACILTPKMFDAGNHKNITLLTWSEVEKVKVISVISPPSITPASLTRIARAVACAGRNAQKVVDPVFKAGLAITKPFVCLP
jgi:heterodisulfide reductase subunit A